MITLIFSAGGGAPPTSTFVFRSGGFPLGGFELEWSLVATSIPGRVFTKNRVPGAPFKGIKRASFPILVQKRGRGTRTGPLCAGQKWSYTYQSEGQTWDIYFSPSKSLEQRQQDAASTLKLDALRLLLGEERGKEVEFELGKGRAYLGDDVLTHRQTYGGEIKYILPTIRKYLPEVTPEALAEAEKTVKDQREATQQLP